MRRLLLALLCGCGGMDFHAEVGWQEDVDDVRVDGRLVSGPFAIDQHFATPDDARAWHFDLTVRGTPLSIGSTCARDSVAEHASVEDDQYSIYVSPAFGPSLSGHGDCDDAHWEE